MSSNIDMHQVIRHQSTLIDKHRIMTAVLNYMVRIFEHPLAISNEFTTHFKQYLENIGKRHAEYFQTPSEAELHAKFNNIISCVGSAWSGMNINIAKDREKCITDILQFIVACDNIQLLNDIEVFVSLRRG